MPRTVRDIITLAMKEAGVLGVGQTLLAEDIDDGLTYLQMMMDEWQERRWLVPALQQYQIAADGSTYYTIGPGGNLDIARPNKISAAWIVQNTTGLNPVSTPLQPIFSFEDYALIVVKTLNSYPDHFFYDGQFPLANFYPIPIANDQYTIYILVEQQFNFPADDLDKQFDLPPMYQRAIHYNLALALCSAYTLQVGNMTARLAKSSLNTLRMNNTQVPRMRMPIGVRKGPAFNLYNADGIGTG